MPGMFSGISKREKKKKKTPSILVGENLYWQRDLPDYNHLLRVSTMVLREPENFEVVTVY